LDPQKRRLVDGGPYDSEYTYQGTLRTTIRLPKRILRELKLPLFA